MILFLTGTWGAGKSYVADKIVKMWGWPQLDADVFHTEAHLAAVRANTFHPDLLDAFYAQLMDQMAEWQRAPERVAQPNFIVTHSVYAERQRRLIYERFGPTLRFVLVETPDEALKRTRIQERSVWNPVTLAAYEAYLQHWEPMQVPHEVLINDDELDDHLAQLKTQLLDQDTT